MKFKILLINILLITVFLGRAQNLITDGSFPTTATTFSTNLTLNCSMGTLSGTEYCVSAAGWHSSDHSTPSDNQLLVNSFDVLPSNPLIWGKTVTVQPGRTYEFSFWTRNRNASNSTYIDIYVDGSNKKRINHTATGWIQHSYSFTSIGTSVTLEIKQVDDGEFYDFDMDDVSLEEVTDWPLVVAAASGSGNTRSLIGAGKNIVSTKEYVYTTGEYMGKVYFNGQLETNNSGNWIPWVAKYSSNKQLRWVANISGTNNSTNTNAQGGVTGIDVDGEDNVYITGYFRNGTINFDGTVLANYSATHSSSYVVKFRYDGRVDWVKHIEDISPQNPGSKNYTGGGIEVDAVDELVYVSGTLAGDFSEPFEMIFPPNLYADYSTGAQRGFLAKFDVSNGDFKGIVTSFDCDYPRDFELTSTRAYLVGSTNGSIGQLPFLASVDLDNWTWLGQNVGTTASTQNGAVYGTSIVHFEGKLYAAGYTVNMDNVCFNSRCTQGTSTDYVGWIGEFGTNLLCNSMACITGPARIVLTDVDVDDQSALFASGTTELLTRYRDNAGTIRKSGSLTSGGVGDIFVAKYPLNLSNVNWAKRFGGSGTNTMGATGHYEGSMNGIYTSATFTGGAMNIGPTNISSPSTGNSFFIGRLLETNGTSFKKDNAVSVSENVYSKGIELYPNPASDYITLSMPEDFESGTFMIYNSLGKLIMQQSVSAGVQSANIESLKEGTYFYKAVSGNGTLYSGPILVQ